MNSSFSVSRRYDISGTEIRPKSLRQKSPNARAMASPGELLFGSQTRATSGSSWRAKTRPLHLRILSASAVGEKNQRKHSSANRTNWEGRKGREELTTVKRITK